MPVISQETLGQLYDAAISAAEKAYAPYSRFRVGAAILYDNGTVSTGCNVENASYGLTLCAERNAIFSAIAKHGAGSRIVAAVVTNLNQAASPPCGACRQVLAEFIAEDAMVYFSNGVSDNAAGLTAVPFAELLPHAFTPERLNHARS